MKKVLAALTAGALALSLCACGGTPASAPTGIYTPGTYSASAKGFGGDVTVTLTTDANAVTAVTLAGDGETPSVGGAALETLAAQLKDAQSAEIDGVTGATLTSNAAKSAAAAALAQARGEQVAAEKTAVADGTYTETVASFGWTGMLTADVTFQDNALTDITVTSEADTYTGEMAYTAFNTYIPRVIEAQSTGVDAVSGATVTSNAIKSAVELAITEAGGDPAQWNTSVEKKSDTVTLDGYDVVVVGLGGSGVLSYSAAAYEGATVFGIETTAKLGGQSATTYGPMVLNATTDNFKDVKTPSYEEVYDVWMDYVESDEKADVIKEAVYQSGEAVDFYVNNFGFSFSGILGSFMVPDWSALWTIYTADNDNTSWNVIGPNKTYQFDRAMETAKALNAKNDYMLELTAEELILDGDKVVGVRAVRYDGTTYEIYGDSIILATGGFIGNADMVKENWGVDSINTVASLVDDGTGILMGQQAGGATYNTEVDPIIHILQVPNLIKNDDLTGEQKAILSALALVPDETAVTVNGEAWDTSTNEAMIPDYHYYNVYTEEQINSYKEKGLTENFAAGASHFMAQGEFTTGTPVADMDTILSVGVQYGNVLKADSLADLAKQIGCDEATLSATLGGNDTTYYAVIAAGYTYGSVGGLDIDANMNVLRADGSAIENVYAVGNDSMGVENVVGKPYTPWGGQAQSWTFVSGRIAGKNAATYGLSK